MKRETNKEYENNLFSYAIMQHKINFKKVVKKKQKKNKFK